MHLQHTKKQGFGKLKINFYMTKYTLTLNINAESKEQALEIARKENILLENIQEKTDYRDLAVSIAHEHYRDHKTEIENAYKAFQKEIKGFIPDDFQEEFTYYLQDNTGVLEDLEEVTNYFDDESIEGLIEALTCIKDSVLECNKEFGLGYRESITRLANDTLFTNAKAELLELIDYTLND